MLTDILRSLGIAVLLVCPLLAQTSVAERFDLSGMPSRPTNFAEQSIQAMIQGHRPGDLQDAALIQHKLARYYADKGDRARARTAEDRAALAEHSGSAPSYGAVPSPAFGPWESCEARNPMFAGTQAPFTGLWYLYNGGSSEETWEFFGDSMFRHTWIAAGSGTSARTSERGRFRVSGNSITLHVTSQTGGTVSPSAGAHGSLLTGGTECKEETRRLSFRLLGPEGADGILLDGVKLKFRNR